MTSEFVLDSYAWIEYFHSSPTGRRVKEMIKNQKAITPTIVIGELSARYGSFEEWEQMLEFKNNFGLADAIILATAREQNAKIVTGDRHFKGMPETIFLE